jgi:hypothetical protein
MSHHNIERYSRGIAFVRLSQHVESADKMPFARLQSRRNHELFHGYRKAPLSAFGSRLVLDLKYASSTFVMGKKVEHKGKTG